MYVVSTCNHYVCYWIFHSSLLTFHFRKAFFTFNFSFLIAHCFFLFLRTRSDARIRAYAIPYYHEETD
ncbi:unknown [Prevotella sp. CAG:255]|nr:unknown [Prevotella sp. CAG:255]